jgi:hypothetical protein
MFLNEYSIVKLLVLTCWFFSSSLLSILYELYKKKEARATVKAILANIPRLCAKSQARARPGPSCQPSGQPGGQANWPAKELACLARGKCYLKKGISRVNSEAAGTSREKVVSRSYQHLSLTFTYLYEPRLLHSIKGQFHETFFFVQCIGKYRSKIAALLFKYFWSQFYSFNFISYSLF